MTTPRHRPAGPTGLELTNEDWQLLGLAHETHRKATALVASAQPGLREFLAPFVEATSANGYEVAQDIVHKSDHKAER